MWSKQRIIHGIKWRYDEFRERRYHRRLFRMAKQMRQKEVINVTFLVNDLPTWKTENLLVEMMHHSRFNPVVGIPEAIERIGSHLEVVAYCKKHGYPYILLDSDKRIKPQTGADIVFYLKPYQTEYHPLHRFIENLDILHMYVFYSFHGILEPGMLNKPMYRVVLYDFYENIVAAEDAKNVSLVKGRNFCVTGLPFADQLLEDKKFTPDQWKDRTPRKRIIYAPHHSVGDNCMKGCNYGTFLEIGEAMLEFAKKYRDQVYFVFKPHPLLAQRLAPFWSKDKIDSYFKEWETMENAQYENGPYMGLFKHSDAMIHDCSSFIAEYLAMDKPVMFLQKDGHGPDYLNRMFQRAQDVHYHGKTREDIETFIQMVIAGKDPKAEERHKFVDDFLRPPHGKSACANIINAILAQDEYSAN